MKKRFYRGLTLVLFLLGLILTEPKTTGSIIGASVQTSTTGILLILLSGLLFITEESLEQLLHKLKKRDHFTEILQKNLYLSGYEAKRLKRGEMVLKTFHNPYYELEVIYRLTKGKLNAALLYVEAKQKPGAQVKTGRAILNFQNKAVEAGKELGFDQVDVYTLVEHNKKFFDALRRRGYKDTETDVFNVIERTDPIRGIVKHFRIKKRKP